MEERRNWEGEEEGLRTVLSVVRFGGHERLGYGRR